MTTYCDAADRHVSVPIYELHFSNRLIQEDRIKLYESGAGNNKIQELENKSTLSIYLLCVFQCPHLFIHCRIICPTVKHTLVEVEAIGAVGDARVGALV